MHLRALEAVCLAPPSRRETRACQLLQDQLNDVYITVDRRDIRCLLNKVHCAAVHLRIVMSASDHSNRMRYDITLDILRHVGAQFSNSLQQLL